ncbi:MAG: hypothetical protein LBI20_02260 [Holosporales bacterium]|nr:hypothetical protein [Holosporales bacterium]
MCKNSLISQINNIVKIGTFAFCLITFTGNVTATQINPNNPLVQVDSRRIITCLPLSSIEQSVMSAALTAGLSPDAVMPIQVYVYSGKKPQFFTVGSLPYFCNLMKNLREEYGIS